MSNVETIKYIKSKAPEFMYETGNDNTLIAIAREPLPELELRFVVEYTEDKAELDKTAAYLSKSLKEALDDLQ